MCRAQRHGETREEPLVLRGGFLPQELAVEIQANFIVAGVDVYGHVLAFHARPSPAFPRGPDGPLVQGNSVVVQFRLADGHIQFLGAVPDDVAIMGDRFAIAGRIQIAAPRAVPEKIRAVRIIPTADARFADVVHGGPDEIADDIRSLCDRCQ